MGDITERNDRELQLQDALTYAEAIVDTLREPLLVLDPELRIRSVNRSFCRTFRVPKEEAENQLIYALGNGEWDFPKLHTLLEELIPKQTAVENFEVERHFTDLGHKVMLFNARKLWLEANHSDVTLLAIEDITDRKRAETALRHSEERWRGLFERMAEGFFLGEMIYNSAGRAFDFRLLEVNPAFEKLTGLANAAGRTVREAIPGIEDDLIQTYGRVVSTEQPANFDIHVPALQNRWYEVRARHTESHRFAVLFLDITERKLSELQLREAERRQAALLALGDQLRDLKGVASLTSAAMQIVGTTLKVARAGYGEVDATQEYVTIQNDWTNGRVPTLSGTYRFKDFGEDLGQRLWRGESIAVPDVSTHPITARESERWKALDVRAVINVPLIQNGRLVAVLFIQDSEPRPWTEADLTFVHKVVDRTWAAAERARALQELQETEEFNRSILASSPDCVNVLNLDGLLLTMNEGGCRQMEMDHGGLRLNQPWPDLWGQTKEVAEKAVIKAREGHATRFEASLPTLNGAEKWWEVVVTPIHDASGKPVRILSLSRDITERRLGEQNRERLASELKRSNEELSQFAHVVAHDLQSPLRGVTSFAQLLQRKAKARLAAEDHEFLGHIVDSAHRMQELVRALLGFAQVGQGNIENKPVEMDLVLDAVLLSLKVPIEEQGALISRGVLPVVSGDSVQLEQLLQNLIGNALKYRRPEEPPRVAITVKALSLEYVFAVEDNGEGISPEYLHKIFEPLERLHGGDVAGTGLGLSICERIVTRHGGRIWVESQPGRGSTFYFTLPPA